MTQDFFLERKDQRDLVDMLASIPRLAEDLAVTECRQDRISKPGGGRIRRGKPESSLPFHVGAASAAWDLHSALSSTVRLVCEQRALPQAQWPADSVVTLAAWLRANIVALALTEGAWDAYLEIEDAVMECRRVIDLPPEDEITVSREQVNAAIRQVVTVSTIATVADKLGELGNGLTPERMRTLCRRGVLAHSSVDPRSGTKFYALGDVLDAHHAYPRRCRA